MSVLQMDCVSEENLGKNAGQNFLNSTVEKQCSRQMSGSAYKTSAGSFTFIRKLKNFWASGKAEVSLFWKDPEFCLDCKARLDWFDPDSGIIVDLKFTNNVDKAGVQKPIQDYYAVQAAWYSRGVYQLTKKTADFLFVFIEKYAPHSIRVVDVSAGDLKQGLQKIESAVKNISNANK